jgi:hypothetical protein
MDASDALMNPIIQYGFAGMSAVLIAIIVWLMNRLMKLLEETNQVIINNTNTIRDVGNRTGEELELLRDVHDKLISRPCIAAKEKK